MQLINYKNIIEENIKNTLSEISRLKNELLNVECVKRVFPTDANFFLIEFNNAENVYQELLKNEILTSKRRIHHQNSIFFRFTKNFHDKIDQFVASVSDCNLFC